MVVYLKTNSTGQGIGEGLTLYTTTLHHDAIHDEYMLGSVQFITNVNTLMLPRVRFGLAVPPWTTSSDPSLALGQRRRRGGGVIRIHSKPLAVPTLNHIHTKRHPRTNV